MPLLDRILVVDLEATCWPHETPEDEQQETIEVGLCEVRLDSGTVALGDRISYLVAPQQSTVSEFCTSLTTLTQEDVEQGLPLDEVLSEIKETHLSSEVPWASWGAWDRYFLQGECDRKGIHFPFHHFHYNVKALFGLMTGKMDTNFNVKSATKELGMEFDGTLHRGHDDAYNIARILKKLVVGSRPNFTST